MAVLSECKMSSDRNKVVGYPLIFLNNSITHRGLVVSFSRNGKDST